MAKLPNDTKNVAVEPKSVYSRSQSITRKIGKTIVTDYELKYNDNHEVIMVEIGQRDLVKEVNSHIGEVGIYNVIKMAIAHGENPQVVFAKKEPGIPFAIDPDATMDDIVNGAIENKTKLDEVAKSLGVSTNDLIKAMNDGTIQSLIDKAVIQKETDDKSKEGGAE